MESENKQFCLKKSNPKGRRSGMDILKGTISAEAYQEMVKALENIEKKQKTHEDVSTLKNQE